MSQPSTPRTPRTPRAGRMSQTPQRSDNLSSDIPSSPGLQYPSSPGLGISSPLPFATAPGFQVVYQPGHGMPETPRRRRNDVVSSPQVARHLASRADPISELPSTPFPPSQDYDPSQVVKVVWGTAVEINEVIRIFKEFLEHFKQKYRIVKENPDVQTITESENRPFYPQLLDQASAYNRTKEQTPAIKLHSLLIDYPAEVLPLLDFTLNEYFDEKHPEVDLGGDSLMIRPFGLGKTVNTRDLGPEDIDRLVTVKGLMLRASSVIPNVKKAFFQCLVCDQTVTSEADRG
ncbi:hypothetical protein BGZ54_004182, partial [Gamsiella multidivaricata]